MTVLVAGLVLAVAGASPAAEAFPERPGKAVVVKICGGCHGLKLLAPMRRTRAAWRTSAEEMLGKGMKADESEIDEAAAYLGRYLNRLNVNTATAADLADILGLTAGQAQRVVAHRDKNGALGDVESVESAAGVAAGTLWPWRDRIAFRGSY